VPDCAIIALDVSVLLRLSGLNVLDGDLTGYHRPSRVETKMDCAKLLGQRLSARDFDRQVAEIQIRAAILNCHSTGHTAYCGHRLSPSGVRESTTSGRFVHVWMPPLVQEISERFECVIGCGHVSGLSLQRLIQPRAGMAMREPKADQQIELIGSCTKTALSGPDLSDHFPLLFIDLLTRSSPGS
jgi:hypothetical protein